MEEEGSVSAIVPDGIHEFDWNIRGMDCADCAMKATKAVSRLPGIKSCKISVTEGTARISLDISRGRISRSCSVLESLGHSPKIDWVQAIGVTPGEAAKNLGTNRKGLRDALLAVPGILAVRFDDGLIELRNVWISDPDLRMLAESMISTILGGNAEFVVSSKKRLRPDQVKLIAAVMTIPVLFAIIAVETMSLPTVLASFLGFFGVILAGSRMFMEAIASIQNGVLGFQVLTSLAVIGASLLGEWVEALTVVGLVSFASHLEDRAITRARESMQGGLDRIPRGARIVNPIQGISPKKPNIVQITPQILPHGEPGKTPVEAVVEGDMVEVRSGEVVPVDGIITSGGGSIDRAPLTGEPVPVLVSEGDFVEAGLTLVRGPIVLRSVATGENTRLSNLVELVREYRDKPTRTHTTIENFTRIWVPIVLLGAPMIGFLTHGWTDQGFLTTLLLWVVSCPCSLLLAAPIPHAAALSTASASGIIVRGGDILEATADVKLALLDKTGTLTSGRPSLTRVTVTSSESEERAIMIAAGLERMSNHPYAHTIIHEASERSLEAVDISEISDGQAGVTGVLEGNHTMLGRSDWLISEGVEFPKDIDEALTKSRRAGHGSSVLSVSGKAIAVFEFYHDDARDGVAELLQSLSDSGISIEILSGDEQSSVEQFARGFGIPASSCRGGVDPEGKAIWVTEKSKAGKTLMAGDGFNDAGALAAADVGIAVGSGEQVNLDAADVLIPGEDPRALSQLITMAKTTRSVVMANVIISVGVTALLVIAVMLGYEMKLAAGVALHEASALLVILNGMWVGGSGIQRIRTLGDLAKDVYGDVIESFSVLFGLSGQDSQGSVDKSVM
ncbi:MAG: heavy metal translocating P-type ATPase [Candidatus Thermoplasmatota archaeon]|nr:heavy metal translocating P-type ATPase [Candidatus Thermoplasmatota archaeon]